MEIKDVSTISALIFIPYKAKNIINIVIYSTPVILNWFRICFRVVGPFIDGIRVVYILSFVLFKTVFREVSRVECHPMCLDYWAALLSL